MTVAEAAAVFDDILKLMASIENYLTLLERRQASERREE